MQTRKSVYDLLCTMLFAFMLLFCATPVFAQTIKLQCGQKQELKSKQSYTNRPDIVKIKNGKIIGLRPGQAKIYTNNKTITVQVTRQIIKKKKPIYVTKNQTKKISNYPCKTRDSKLFKLKNGYVTGKRTGKGTVTITKPTKKIIQPIVIESPKFSEKKYHASGNYAKIGLSDTHEKVRYQYDDYYIEREGKKFYLYENYGITNVTAKINKQTIDTCKLYIGNVIPYTIQIKSGKSTEIYNKKARELVDFTIKSDDPKIATVSKTGRITARKKGITKIRAKVMGKEYVGTVVVVDTKPAFGYMKINKASDFKPWISPMLYKAICDFKLNYHVTPVLPAYKNDPDIAGYISISEHDIYIRSDQNYAEVTFHELGHFLNHVKGYADDCPEWKAIFQKEAFADKRYWRDYARTSYNEFFAEAFVKYIFEPGLMMQKSPKTYAFVNKQYKSITDEDIRKLIEKYPYNTMQSKSRTMPEIESDPIMALQYAY